jgi:hypothetical protein
VRDIAACETMKIGGSANRAWAYRTVNITLTYRAVRISPNSGHRAVIILPWTVRLMARLPSRSACGR